MCKSWCELIIGIIVVVFSLWQTMISEWVLVIAGIVLIIHSFTCKACFNKNMSMPAPKARRR